MNNAGRTRIKAKYLFREVDQRAGQRNLPLLSVSAAKGVVPRSTLTEAEARADDLSIYKVCRHGDIVINRMSAYQGAAGIAPITGIVSPDYMVLSVLPGIEARFFSYLARSSWFSNQVRARLRGIGSPGQGNVRTPRLTVEELGNMVISLPTVEQQRKIADFLDTESLRIDALATKKRLLEQMLADRMLATIEQFIWGQNFALAPLRRIAQFVDYRGATPSKSSSGVPLITASHVKEGMLDFESEPQWVDENTYKDWMRRGWPATGDVLLTTEAPLGKVAQITNHQVALAQRIVLLKPMARGTLADFLAYALRSPSFQHQLMANATGSTALGIKADRLKGLRIPVPSLEIQRAYARTLYEKASVIASSRQKLMAQVDLLHEHLQRVTTAAITGEMEIAEARQ